MKLDIFNDVDKNLIAKCKFLGSYKYFESDDFKLASNSNSDSIIFQHRETYYRFNNNLELQDITFSCPFTSGSSMKVIADYDLDDIERHINTGMTRKLSINNVDLLVNKYLEVILILEDNKLVEGYHIPKALSSDVLIDLDSFVILCNRTKFIIDMNSFSVSVL